MTCARCGSGIFKTEDFISLNKVWHKCCFTCYQCDKLLDKYSAKIFQGELFCECCYTRVIEKLFKALSTPSVNRPRRVSSTPSCKIDCGLGNNGLKDCENLLKSTGCCTETPQKGPCGSTDCKNIPKAGPRNAQSCLCIPTTSNKKEKEYCFLFPMPREVANYYNRSHMNNKGCIGNSRLCSSPPCPNCSGPPPPPCCIRDLKPPPCDQCTCPSCPVRPKKCCREPPQHCENCCPPICSKGCECCPPCMETCPPPCPPCPPPKRPCCQRICCFPSSPRKSPSPSCVKRCPSPPQCCSPFPPKCQCQCELFQEEHCCSKKSPCCPKNCDRNKKPQCYCKDSCAVRKSDSCLQKSKCCPQKSPCCPRKSPCCPEKILRCRCKRSCSSKIAKVQQLCSACCIRCGQKVYAAEKILVSSGAFHTSCFSCYCCNKVLDVKNVFEGRGEIYCQQCYNHFFGVEYYGFGRLTRC